MDEQTNKTQKIITDKCYGRDRDSTLSRGLLQRKARWGQHATLTVGVLTVLTVKGHLDQQLQHPYELGMQILVSHPEPAAPGTLEGHPVIGVQQVLL